MQEKRLNKICIFCGNKPENKNKEHIIPKWLINLTGDNKRPFSLFLYNEQKGYIKNEATPFDQFVFPACSNCNSEYAELEGKASVVINALLAKTALDENDFTVLLDWLDKERIGMWLALRFRDNNAFQVEPNFYISQRLRKSDRLVRISHTSKPSKRLTVIGANTPSFMRMPSAFGLHINQLSLISVSNMFLLSRRMGWPFPSKTLYTKDGLFECEMTNGLERVIQPIIRLPVKTPGKFILQSTVPPEILNNKMFYESKFFYESCLDQERKISKIYIQKSDHTSKLLGNNKSKEWIPSPVDLDSNSFADQCGVEILKIQNFLWSEMLDIPFESKEHKQAMRKMISSYRKFNEQQIDTIK